MASLQIRDVPEPLRQLLMQRARTQKRSLSQQALVDLEALVGGDPRARRRQVLQRIQERWQRIPPMHWDEPPEELIRADRER
ncbi:hypothetical protein [Cyanobium sp. CH-040]|uniref:hypothetical protein n=1 Tax=Cyanobium sp. CH-040 TaxID=2823708 RepID=UPI0020CCA88C|nr:hypothetical protein [Cyanobium sp. CH-040]MCP9926368.1 hypothetical protein [Cyanobium sp. CH-040]